MNNSYYSSSSFNDYTPSYNYSYQYSSPSTSGYYYSPLLLPSCPVHSPTPFCTSTPSSMNLPPIPYTYYEQQSQVNSPPVQQQMHTDRTPLRRHKCFKKNELQVLHQAYIHNSHPSTDVLQHLALQLKVPIDKVRQWFKNRRHSDKLKKREAAMGQKHN